MIVSPSKKCELFSGGKMKKFFFVLFIAPIYLANVLFANNNIVDCSNNPILSEYVYKIRDPKTNKKEFRSCLRKIGEFLSYQIAEDLQTKEKTITTMMGMPATHRVVDSEDLVLITVLRAGVPFFNGVLNIFKNAQCGFLGMMRDEETLKAKVDYVAIPPLEGKTVLLTDTMLATGGSIIDTIKIIEKKKPKK
jgi:uracil phosphoribosyltransferase